MLFTERRARGECAASTTAQQLQHGDPIGDPHRWARYSTHVRSLRFSSDADNVRFTKLMFVLLLLLLLYTPVIKKSSSPTKVIVQNAVALRQAVLIIS